MSLGAGNYDPTQEVQFGQTKFASYMQSNSYGNHFGSHKVVKSAIVQCCRRFKCCYLIWLYAGQLKHSAARPPHNPATCTLDTASLSYLGEHRLRSGLCLPADHWHPVLNLLISLLFDAHLTTRLLKGTRLLKIVMLTPRAHHVTSLRLIVDILREQRETLIRHPQASVTLHFLQHDPLASRHCWC